MLSASEQRTTDNGRRASDPPYFTTHLCYAISAVQNTAGSRQQKAVNEFNVYPGESHAKNQEKSNTFNEYLAYRFALGFIESGLGAGDAASFCGGGEVGRSY
jgi:hypothetical protein